MSRPRNNKHRGRSAAFMRELRRKYGLGEFSKARGKRRSRSRRRSVSSRPSSTRSRRRTARSTRHRRRPEIEDWALVHFGPAAYSGRLAGGSRSNRASSERSFSAPLTIQQQLARGVTGPRNGVIGGPSSPTQVQTGRPINRSELLRSSRRPDVSLNISKGLSQI